MFVIRAEQMRVFAEELEEEFARRLATATRDRAPDSEPRAHLSTVKQRIAQARVHGLTWESSIADFVGLTFDVGPAFDRHPRVAALLSDPETAPDLRLGRLFTALTSPEWDDVRAFAREHASER